VYPLEQPAVGCSFFFIGVTCCRGNAMSTKRRHTVSDLGSRRFTAEETTAEAEVMELFGKEVLVIKDEKETVEESKPEVADAAEKVPRDRQEAEEWGSKADQAYATWKADRTAENAQAASDAVAGARTYWSAYYMRNGTPASDVQSLPELKALRKKAKELALFFERASSEKKSRVALKTKVFNAAATVLPAEKLETSLVKGRNAAKKLLHWLAVVPAWITLAMFCVAGFLDVMGAAFLSGSLGLFAALAAFVGGLVLQSPIVAGFAVFVLAGLVIHAHLRRKKLAN
jgi:hypothetical protein